MTDRPILFSAPMVRALLDGRKTQTRRILKPQLECFSHADWPEYPAAEPVIDLGGVRCRVCGGGMSLCRGKPGVKGIPVRFSIGDRLWVREAWRTEARYDHYRPSDLTEERSFNRVLVSYDADYDQEPNDGCRGKTRVSIHMPRWASRLTLTVTDVRVQRLQEISEDDCIAEGIQKWPLGYRVAISGAPKHECRTFDQADWAYRTLWDTINGAGSWDANPWIVALTFTVDPRNIDQVPT